MWNFVLQILAFGSAASLCITLHLDKSGFIFFDEMVVDANKVSFSASLLQAEQCQLSRRLLIKELLQALDHLCGFSLKSLLSVLVSLVPGRPELDTVFQMCLTRAAQAGRISSLGLLAIFCLMQPGIPLAFFARRAHCWLMVNLSPTRISRSFPTKLLSGQLTAACPGAVIIPYQIQGYMTGNLEASVCHIKMCKHIQIDLISLAQIDSSLFAVCK